jgi:hypothetical protein
MQQRVRFLSGSSSSYCALQVLFAVNLVLAMQRR